jgi:hypothetical protein
MGHVAIPYFSTCLPNQYHTATACYINTTSCHPIPFHTRIIFHVLVPILFLPDPTQTHSHAQRWQAVQLFVHTTLVNTAHYFETEAPQFAQQSSEIVDAIKSTQPKL